MGERTSDNQNRMTLTTEGGSVVSFTIREEAIIPPLAEVIASYKAYRLQMAELRGHGSDHRDARPLNSIDIIQYQVGRGIVEPLIRLMGGQAMLENMEIELRHEFEQRGHMLFPAAQQAQRIGRA